MSAVLQVAASTLRRSIRDRTFVMLGLVAPFLIMASLSATIGTALAGEFRPSLVIVDDTGGGLSNDLIEGLRGSGFDDVSVADSDTAAQLAVENGDADAAIVLPAELIDLTVPPRAIRVIADAESEVAAEIATAVADQLATDISTNRLLLELGAGSTDLAAPITIASSEDVGSSVLTDATYFAVGMSSFFSFFAASLFLAGYHQERKQSTLARMLLAPVGRLTPMIGKALGIACLTLMSYVALVVASTVLLGADWGPAFGVVVTGLALVFTAVAVGVAVVAFTDSEEAATQIGMVLATAWAIFGGVFVEIPTSGPLATVARLSPFTWALNGIGLNAGTGRATEVFAHALVIAGFGVVAAALTGFARRQIVRP